MDDDGGKGRSASVDRAVSRFDFHMPSVRRPPIDVVLDVRSRIEFWFGHLDGATCIPVDTLADTLSERAGITKDMRILVYCASGARSAVAVEVLGADRCTLGFQTRYPEAMRSRGRHRTRSRNSSTAVEADGGVSVSHGREGMHRRW